MLNLLLLPPEIAAKITEQLDGIHKKITRLVCKHLNSVVERQLFSNIVLKYSNYQPDLICEQLEALAFRTTAARNHARSIEIRGFSPDSHLGARSRSRSVERDGGSRSRSRGPLAEAHSTNKSLLAYLGQAICSLTKVQEVWWHLSPNDPEWVKITVMDSLAALPFLEVLRLSLGGASAASLKLQSLSNLRKITINGHCPEYREDIVSGLVTLISNSPDLSHLDVGFRTRGLANDRSALHDLLRGLQPGTPLPLSHLALQGYCVRLDSVTLPHLRSLQSISLYGVVDARQNTPPVLDESAMEDLLARMASCCFSNDGIWDALREERIFLKEISTDAVGTSLLDYLASYSGLEKLNLSCASARNGSASDALAVKFYKDVLPRHARSLVALDICPEYEGKWCFGRHNSESLLRCTQLVTLKIHIHSSEINRGKEQDVVWTLLSVADHLLNLSHLTIASADSEDNRDGRSGNPSIGHIYRVNKEISQSVTTFGPVDPSTISKVITTPARDYVARSDPKAGAGLWYRSSMSQGSHLEL